MDLTNFCRNELPITLLYAAVACAVRPTNAIIWVYTFVWLLWKLRDRPQDIFFVLINALFTGYVFSCTLILLVLPIVSVL